MEVGCYPQPRLLVQRVCQKRQLARLCGGILCLGSRRIADQSQAGLGRGEFDFVVSNPPYVGDSEADQVQLEVRKYEPRNAVFAGATGLEVIERLIPQARESLKPEGWLVMEISGTIADGVRDLLAGWNDVQIAKDLQGIERVVSARAT